MRKRVKYKVSVRVSRFGGGDIAALLDMLRYEGATVENWSSLEGGFRVTISSENPVLDRWNSFGLYPEVVG